MASCPPIGPEPPVGGGFACIETTGITCWRRGIDPQRAIPWRSMRCHSIPFYADSVRADGDLPQQIGRPCNCGIFDVWIESVSRGDP